MAEAFSDGGDETLLVRAERAFPAGVWRGAKSGAPNAENTPLHPDLALIQDRWPKLPEHIRQAVLSLVRSTSDKEQVL
jgi:hypothetical protein